MAKADSSTARPRGTKPVSQAFFTALDSVPAAQQSAVGKAALAMIRDEIRNRRDKQKAMAAKAKASGKVATAAPKTTPRKPPVTAPEPAETSAPAPRRARRKPEPAAMD